MKYLSFIVSIWSLIKKIIDTFLLKRQIKRRLQEKKKVDDFKIETEKNVKDGDIDDINNKLKF
jgi:hypothetical protein